MHPYATGHASRGIQRLMIIYEGMGAIPLQARIEDRDNQIEGIKADLKEAREDNRNLQAELITIGGVAGNLEHGATVALSNCFKRRIFQYFFQKPRPIAIF